MKFEFREIYDKNDNLLKILVVNMDTGESELQFLWDDRDEQTDENKKAFRKWAERFWQQKQG